MENSMKWSEAWSMHAQRQGKSSSETHANHQVSLGRNTQGLEFFLTSVLCQDDVTYK